DPDTLDPMGQTTTTVQNMVDYMAEPLVTLDTSGKIQPGLAKSWQISTDGLTYTFNLQQGVKFHDGANFDAAAVKANFDRLLDPDNTVPLRGVMNVIQKVEVVDPATVKFTLKAPTAPLLAALTITTASILSPASIDKSSPNYKKVNQPVGTGPYVFKEYTKGSQVVVTKNPNYWGKKPYYDSVVFRIVPEAATRESLLLAGQVDLIILPPVSDIPALQKNSAVKVLLSPSDRTIFVAINTTSKPLDNPKVRQALNYAVNKEDIVKNILFGAADPLDAPIANSLFGYCKTGPYSYDPAKAKQLLSEAGVAPGTKLAFMSPTGRYVQDFQAAQAIAGYLKDVGIDATPTTMDWPSYVATMTKPQAENTTQLHVLGWAPAYLDESQQILQFLSSEHPPKGLATSFYKSKADDLAAQALSEPDEKKRADLYCQANKVIWDDAPWIFLWTQRFPMVYSAKVKGVSGVPNEKFAALYAEPAQ
ncbi:MAG: ABC transporter substrate-binding protein, partial [Acidobacteriota bacterium]